MSHLKRLFCNTRPKLNFKIFKRFLSKICLENIWQLVFWTAHTTNWMFFFSFFFSSGGHQDWGVSVEDMSYY